VTEIIELAGESGKLLRGPGARVPGARRQVVTWPAGVIVELSPVEARVLERNLVRFR
jgi:hypothetical protein